MSGELAFIEALRGIARDPAARNLEDDCAVLEVGGETLVLTHDTLVEGVHFLAGQDPADIAWKLVSVNLSDLAAKGARPVGVLLGYMTDGNEARFLEGLQEALSHYGAPLLGGDTAGCEALQSGTGKSLAYRRPEARLAEGIALASHVSAMMDISDGLLLDALRMARASGVTIAIESAAVPLCVPEARRDEALRWGDDYQLLFTASPTTALPVPATRIGTVCNHGSHPLLLDGQPAKGKLGYEHG